MSEALYNSEQLAGLVQEENVFDGVFECLHGIWGNEDAMSDRELAQSEYRTRLLEQQLSRFYPALYEELQQQTSSHPVTDADSDSIVIMDALSLREAFRLAKDLPESHADWDVDVSWAMVEQLPTDTKFACQAWFDRNAPSAVNRDDFRYIGSQDVPKLPGTDPEYIWTRFPDHRLEGALKGNYSVEDVLDIYEDTKTLLEDIIHQSVHKRFLVTSDHGYVNHLGHNPYRLSDDEEAALSEKFSGRYGAVGNSQPYRLLEDANIIERVRDQHVLRGHYASTGRGASKKIMHGGMSFTECMTPVIEINTTGGN